jgi:hypothetical protein
MGQEIDATGNCIGNLWVLKAGEQSPMIGLTMVNLSPMPDDK